MCPYGFRYQLIRHVPDLARMEPLNIGVIVQSDEGIRLHINSSFRGAPDFDFGAFREWREFFASEVEIQGLPLTGPPRTSRDFLTYLQSRCRGNYRLTDVLAYAQDSPNLDKALMTLYNRLVARPSEELPEPTAPVRRFKYELDRLKLRNLPALRHDEFVEFDTGKHPFYYWYENGRLVLIDKVEWSAHRRLTQLELDAVAYRLMDIAGLPAPKRRIHMVMDTPPTPGSEATDADKTFYDYYLAKRQVIKCHCDELVSTAKDAAALAEVMQNDLRQITRECKGVPTATRRDDGA